MAQLQAQYHLFISCGQCRGVIWADVVVGWCVVCTDHDRPRALEAAGFEQGAEGGAAPGSPCRCRRDRDAGSRGTSRTSGAPLHGRPPRADARRQVDHLGFGFKTPEEGPVVGGGADLGTPLSDMRDFACELRLQCALSALGHAAETDGLQALTVVEGDRATGRPRRQQASERPPSPARSATMTPSSEAVTASCGMSSASRMSGPRLSQRSCMVRRYKVLASWRRACRRTPPLPAPCSGRSSSAQAAGRVR